MELCKFEWRSLENLAKQGYIHANQLKKKNKLGKNGNRADGLHRDFWNILRT